MDQANKMNDFTKGNFEMIFYIISSLSLAAIALFSYEIYRNHKTSKILSGDISKYEYLLNDDYNEEGEFIRREN